MDPSGSKWKDIMMITVTTFVAKSYMKKSENLIQSLINPLNTKLNPFCHLLALLGAHHILHVSRIKVKVI